MVDFQTKQCSATAGLPYLRPQKQPVCRSAPQCKAKKDEFVVKQETRSCKAPPYRRVAVAQKIEPFRPTQEKWYYLYPKAAFHSLGDGIVVLFSGSLACGIDDGPELADDPTKQRKHEDEARPPEVAKCPATDPTGFATCAKKHVEPGIVYRLQANDLKSPPPGRDTPNGFPIWNFKSAQGEISVENFEQLNKAPNTTANEKAFVAAVTGTAGVTPNTTVLWYEAAGKWANDGKGSYTGNAGLANTARARGKSLCVVGEGGIGIDYRGLYDPKKDLLRGRLPLREKPKPPVICGLGKTHQTLSLHKFLIAVAPISETQQRIWVMPRSVEKTGTTTGTTRGIANSLVVLLSEQDPTTKSFAPKYNGWKATNEGAYVAKPHITSYTIMNWDLSTAQPAEVCGTKTKTQCLDPLKNVIASKVTASIHPGPKLTTPTPPPPPSTDGSSGADGGIAGTDAGAGADALKSDTIRADTFLSSEGGG